MAKRPAILFYTGDWLRDTALRTCSIGARGMWIDMLCYMHDGKPYGHLKVNNKVILISNLAAMVGLTINVAEGYLTELLDAGVCQRADDGTIYSIRMVRDEELRQKRATGGHLGGNPSLKKNKKKALKDNDEVIEKDNLKGYPSLDNDNDNVNEDENTEEGGTGEETKTPGTHHNGHTVVAATPRTFRATLQSMLSNVDSLKYYFTDLCEQQRHIHLINRHDLQNDEELLYRWGEAFNTHLITKGVTAKLLGDWCKHFMNWTNTQNLKLQPEKIFEQNDNSKQQAARTAAGGGHPATAILPKGDRSFGKL